MQFDRQGHLRLQRLYYFTGYMLAYNAVSIAEVDIVRVEV
jgi:hypothetical protein